MASLVLTRPSARFARSPSRASLLAPVVGRTFLILVIALAFVGGMLATNTAQTATLIAGAGGDWARLLRAMAALKMLFAAAAAAAVLWRLAAPISLLRWSAYALAAAATWAGPGLIWGLAHIPLGALLLHGGLIATAVLLWRDPMTRVRLSELVARRRGAVTAREG